VALPILALVELIKKEAKNKIRICEIGCWTGDTTKEYAPTVKENNGEIVVIDWFNGNYNIEQNHHHGYRPENKYSIKNEFIKYIGKEFLDIVVIIDGNSQDKKIIDSIPNGYFDIIFIDGSHFYQDVKNDIINYMPKVKDGGILCGHDFEDIEVANTFSIEELRKDYITRNVNGTGKGYHPGVIQAVYDVFEKDIESIDDPDGQGSPIWIKRLKGNKHIMSNKDDEDISKQGLIDFEADIADCYEKGMIKAPVHLRGGCEEQLIEIFKEVKPDDYVFCYWASHLHCLLKGVPKYKVRSAILEGKSISLCFPEYKIFCSGIVGSLAGVAAGTALALKRQGKKNKVWLFTGDMGSYCGIYLESKCYSEGFSLPIVFVEENNGLSVMSPTEDVWGPNNAEEYPKYDYFDYKNTWPHSGINKKVSF